MTKNHPREQTVIRATDPRGLVSVIPAQFGYRPENSIVVLPMRRKRSVGGARIQLSQAQQPSLAARSVLNPLRSAFRPEAIIIAVYTDESLPAAVGADDVPLIDTRVVALPHQAAVDAFRDEAARLGISTMVAFYVGPDGFCEYTPPVDEQDEHNTVVQFWAHEHALTHPELVGLVLGRDPRAIGRMSDSGGSADAPPLAS